MLAVEARETKTAERKAAPATLPCYDFDKWNDPESADADCDAANWQ